MGLDAHAYSRIKKERVEYNENYELCDTTGSKLPVSNPHEYFYLQKNEDFPEHAKDISFNGFYSFVEEAHVSQSYSGFNNFREKLAESLGYPAVDYKEYDGKIVKSHLAGAWEQESGPFIEFLNFSDCEGVIGTRVCKKLLKDFQTWSLSAKEKLDEGHCKKYFQWLDAFSIASEDGCIAYC